MRKNLSLVFTILTIIAVITLLLDYKIKPQVRSLDEIANDSYQPKNHAPDFTFTDLKDRKASLNDLKGKIVILHFWATWCAPCIREFPKLVEVSKEFSDDIALLAVSSDDQIGAITRFTEKTLPKMGAQKNIYLIWDKNRAITHDLYQTFAYPETIIIDREGQMIRKIPCDADWTSPGMKSYLKDITASLAKAPQNP